MQLWEVLLKHFFLFLFVVCSSSLKATELKEQSEDSFFDLTLEELLNIEISVASAKVESIINTPAVVSRFERSDLELMGITNLRDMFNFVPGVILQESMTGIASVQVRGIDETFNQKVLFLVDGVPYYQFSHSFIALEGVPWESISHIEVIRGPGAVFHGTQASGGVLNVVTRKDLNDSALVKVGKDSVKEGSTYLSHQFDKGSSVFVAAEIREDGGYTQKYQQYFPEVGVVEDDVTRVLERKSLTMKYLDQGLVVFLQSFSDHTVGVNDAFTNAETLQPFIIESNGYLIHAENVWSWQDTKMKLFSDYNHYTFDLTIENLFGVGIDALANKGDSKENDNRFRIGTQIVHKVSDTLDLVGGFETEARSVGNYSLHMKSNPSEPLVNLITSKKIKEHAIYAQTEITNGNWRFVVGGRFTDNELSGEKFTPRLAAVYQLDNSQTIKVLYSTGFNSPNPTQTDIYLPGNVIGNQALRAEVVEAYDLAYSYSKENILFVANVYQLEATDFIVRRYSEPLDSISFFNEGSYTRSGAEIDFQLTSNNKKIFANLAYQKDGNRLVANDLDAFRIPKLTASLGATYKLNKHHNIGFNLYHIGARQNLDGFTVVNLNYSFTKGKAEIFTNLRNVFDETIVNPNNSSQNSQLIAQGKQGSDFEIGVRYNF